MTEERTLRCSRTLQFSPAEIFGAFASEKLLAMWWGPAGFSNTIEVFEFVYGGHWNFVMHGPDGKNYRNESIFQELVPDTRIIIRHDCPPHFTLTVELTPTCDGTYLSWEQVFDDAKIARAVAQRVGSANDENIDRLEQVLKNARAEDPEALGT